MSVYTEVLPANPLLGRNVEHDDESLSYGAMGWPWSRIRSVEWTRRIPILDQSNLHRQGIVLPNGEDSLGSCTCQELVGWFGTDNAFRPGLTEIVLPARKSKGEPSPLWPSLFGPGLVVPLGEPAAVEFYQWVTGIDPYRGQFTAPSWDDTGSSGLSTTKIGKSIGQVRSYRHAFSLRQFCTLLQGGPVGMGVVWFDSMFEPRADGRIEVVESSGIAGGHQCLARQLDVENRRVWIDNSWNSRWGVEGRGYLTLDDWQTLAGYQGDFIGRVPSQVALV